MSSEFPQLPAWLRVARIVKPQGHRGEVLADLLTDFPDRFKTQPAVWLRRAEEDAPLRVVTVEHFRMHKDRIVLRLAGCASMNDAEALRGLELVVPWEERMPRPEDEIYVAELAGCVLMDARSGAAAGTVVDIDRESTEEVLLVIETGDGRELLVPFVRAYAPRWEPESRTLRMELPEGLLDLANAETDTGPREDG